MEHAVVLIQSNHSQTRSRVDFFRQIFSNFLRVGCLRQLLSCVFGIFIFHFLEGNVATKCHVFFEKDISERCQIENRMDLPNA